MARLVKWQIGTQLDVIGHCLVLELTDNTSFMCGGVETSLSVLSSPDRAVWVQALARDIKLCSWARHLTLSVPLSIKVYNWVLGNLMLGSSTVMDKHPIHGRVEILVVGLVHATDTGDKAPYSHTFRNSSISSYSLGKTVCLMPFYLGAICQLGS